MPPEEDITSVLSAIISEIKIPPPRMEEFRAMFRGVVIRRFKEGYVDEKGLRVELILLGYRGEELDRIVDAAQLEYDLDYKGELVKLFTLAFQKGAITAEEFYSRLVEIPVVPQRAAAIVQKEQIRLKPKPKPPKEPVKLELTAAQIGARLKAGILEYEDALKYLMEKDYSKTDAELFLAAYLPE